MAASPSQLAKRALVILLIAFAKSYGVPLGITRDSPDKLVLESFRKVIGKAHPDKGGFKADVRKLNAAREPWEKAQNALKSAKPSGDVLGTVLAKGGFRICSLENILLLWLPEAWGHTFKKHTAAVQKFLRNSVKLKTPFTP